MDLEAAQTAFYDTLFDLKPELRAHFGDPENRDKMFSLGLKAIDDYETQSRNVDVYLAWLGDRHKRLNLSEEDAAAGLLAFRKALLAAGLRLDTPEADRFILAYDKIIQHMGIGRADT